MSLIDDNPSQDAKNPLGFAPISLEEYESMMESAYLLSNPANAARLMQSLQEAQSGKRTPMDALGL